jgi:hypothetical protein
VLAVALVDLDADGDLDAFVGKGTPFTPAANQVLLNDGQGNFVDSGQRLGLGISWDVAIGDVNNDGYPDAVVANEISSSPSQVWFNDGQGNFENSGQSLAGKYGFAIALGDLDGDGDLDAYLGGGFNRPSDHVLINDGMGTFADSGQEVGRRFAVSVQLGDFDADGDLDVYVANGGIGGAGSNQPNEIWLNDGDANFTDSGQRLGNEISIEVALGDLDRDGDLDAFVVNGAHDAAAQPKKIWLNDGTGVFDDSGQDIGTPSWGLAVSLGDLDGDGDLDAFVGNLSQDNEIWFNTRTLPGDTNQDGVVDAGDINTCFAAIKSGDDSPDAIWTKTGKWITPM